MPIVGSALEVVHWKAPSRVLVDLFNYISEIQLDVTGTRHRSADDDDIRLRRTRKVTGRLRLLLCKSTIKLPSLPIERVRLPIGSAYPCASHSGLLQHT